MNVSCLWSVNHNNVSSDVTRKKSLIRTNAEINNSKSTISNDRIQPQISGAFLFLTKFRNSVYFLNMCLLLFQKYTPCIFVLHSENGGNIFKYTFSLKCRIVSFIRKKPYLQCLHEAVLLQVCQIND